MTPFASYPPESTHPPPSLGPAPMRHAHTQTHTHGCIRENVPPPSTCSVEAAASTMRPRFSLCSFRSSSELQCSLERPEMRQIVSFVAPPPRETHKPTGAFLLIRPRLFRPHLYTAPFFLLPLHALPRFPFYGIVHLLSAKNEIKKKQQKIPCIHFLMLKML